MGPVASPVILFGYSPIVFKNIFCIYAGNIWTISGLQYVNNVIPTDATPIIILATVIIFDRDFISFSISQLGLIKKAIIDKIKNCTIVEPRLGSDPLTHKAIKE